jgi:hypothetical protein
MSLIVSNGCPTTAGGPSWRPVLAADAAGNGFVRGLMAHHGVASTLCSQSPITRGGVSRPNMSNSMILRRHMNLTPFGCEHELSMPPEAHPSRLNGNSTCMAG